MDHRHLLAGVPSRFKKWLATATKREKTEEDHQVDRFLFDVLILIISLILIGNEEKVIVWMSEKMPFLYDLYVFMFGMPVFG